MLTESYRLSAPPVRLSWEGGVRRVLPAKVSFTLVALEIVAKVTVSISLLDISAIRETDNEIDVKLALHLMWVESRALYHNLKAKLSMNTLNKEEAASLWVPNLIYRCQISSPRCPTLSTGTTRKTTIQGPRSRSSRSVGRGIS